MAVLALRKHPAPIAKRRMVTLPAGRVTISTPSWLIGILFSLHLTNALTFNPHSSPVRLSSTNSIGSARFHEFLHSPDL
ncbi:MAG: hypothetical protein JWO19_2940 [Bryobacterales bacterium]|nr:hypothetical protein [Bryobacterales bacterium]